MSTAAPPSSNPTQAPTPRRDLPTFIFAGGGSGGHIFPGMAIAAEIQRLAPRDLHALMVFVTSDRAIDEKITRSMPHPVEVSPAKPMVASPMGVLRFLKGWHAARRHAREVLTGHRGVVKVVALGGFVAAPFVREAKSLGVPVTMVNLDAVPGKANRYIAKLADHIFTAARVPESHKPRSLAPWVEVPPIVGLTAAKAGTVPTERYRTSLNLDPQRPVLMITGGSQGLRSLNEFVTAFAESPAGQRTLRDGRWQVLHQTGRNLDEPARAAYQRAGIDARVVAFNEVMGMWYGAADLVVSTAGAGNIAEIWSSKTPALLLPYPHHKDEHQKFNAAPLAECQGAIVGKDWIDPALNLTHNGPILESLLADPAKRAAMRVNLENLGPADGAPRIARALLAGIPSPA